MKPEVTTVPVDKTTYEIIKTLAALDRRSVRVWLNIHFENMSPQLKEDEDDGLFN